MHIVIVANGVIGDVTGSRTAAEGADLLLCADGGALYVLGWGLTPDVVIGDMDSLDAAYLERLETAGVELVRHLPHKDETDLELALDRAVHEGASEITILGALGGRIDQTIANILLLTRPCLEGATVSILDGRERLFLARDSVTIRGKEGDTVSLMPLSSEVTNITTTGLEYPLRGESLCLGPSRGISNIMTSDEAAITLGDGLLLVTHHGTESVK